MGGRVSRGRCGLCGDVFSRAGMTRHLESCIRKKTSSEEELGHADGGARGVKLYHLRVGGYGLPEYWMHLQVRADALLEELDSFLRDTWLECCGHLSRFTIQGMRYASYPIEELDEEDMKVSMGEVLNPGVRFMHEYDYGTTTELVLKVVSEHEGRVGPGEGPVKVLARNEPPQLTCNVCGRRATLGCAQCIWMGEGWLCDGCAPRHRCGEEMLLPVVNSPRVGMCGYTGEQDPIV